MPAEECEPVRLRPIRAEYEQHGVRGYYESRGNQYANPHAPMIERALKRSMEIWRPSLHSVLDLACGNGVVTLFLRSQGARSIHGIDPFTADSYRKQTGAAAERLTFEDIAAGALAGRRYSLIVCSFALHLVDRSRLPSLAFHLSLIGDSLLVLTPHKRPVIKPTWGWNIVGEAVESRVRSRYYVSRNLLEAHA